MTSAAASPVRRLDLDWIRVAAFGLLIVYHVGLVYAPYDWHVHSRHTFEWMREAVLITNPWRLTLLFLVSGAALRFMTMRRDAGQVARARAERLIPPLLFGTVILVPIQSWIEALDKGAWTGGLPGWWWHEFSPSGLIDGVPVNHLWFIVYIAAYSAAVVVLMTQPQSMERAENRLVGLLSGWRVMVVPILYLVTIRLTLFPIFGVTNNLGHDWYNHVLSLGAFFFGFLIVRREEVWRDLERYRWVGVGLACVALPIMMMQTAHPGGGAFWGVPRNLVFAIDQWAVISAILGFGSRHLRHVDSRVLRYLTDAVFTCYLAHQTILVSAVWAIRPLNLPAATEAAALALVTIGGSLLIYEIVRRLPLIRPIWGLKPDSSRVAAAEARRLRSRASDLPRAGGLALARDLLAVGIAAPLIALASVLVAAGAYPGFDHARQYLSELGGATAAYPAIFNGGILIAGVMTGIAGLGFGLALLIVARAPVSAVLTGILFVLAGIGLVVSSLYVWPDPRHMAISLGLGIQLAPVFILFALRQNTGMAGMKRFLGVVFLLMLALTVLTKHVVFPGTVNDLNVGYWERAFAIILVGWVGVAAWLLRTRLSTDSRVGADDGKLHQK